MKRSYPSRMFAPCGLPISPRFTLLNTTTTVCIYSVCVCVCVVISFILDVRLVDAPAGVTQEKGHTGFLHLPSAAACLNFHYEKHSAVLFLRRPWKSDFVYLFTVSIYSTYLQYNVFFPDASRSKRPLTLFTTVLYLKILQYYCYI